MKWTEYRKLAEKYNVNKGQVQRRGTSEGWPEERKRYLAGGTQDTGTAFLKRFPKDADVESRINLLVDLGLEKLRKGIEMVQPTDTSALRQLLSSLKDIKEIAGVKLGLERRMGYKAEAS